MTVDESTDDDSVHNADSIKFCDIINQTTLKNKRFMNKHGEFERKMIGSMSESGMG